MADPAVIDSRYSRQILFGPIGEAGQAKLRSARVTLIGCGALGTGIANNLARAGVGNLKICDRDFVELSNLQRQNLFDEDDVRNNMPKAAAAVAKINKINSDVNAEAVVADVNFTNIEKLIGGADLVMDGTDNFETRFVLNDATQKHKIPWIYGGCVGSYGMVMTIVPGETPCLRCAFGEAMPPGTAPTCDTAGVLNTVANIVSSFQSNEAIKFLTGNRAAVATGLLNLDVWTNEMRRFKVTPDPACPCCAKKNYEFLEAKGGAMITSLCGRNAIQIVVPGGAKLAFTDLAEKLKPLGQVTFNRFLFKFAVDACELTLFTDGRAIIKGTTDVNRAKSLYSKYIGG